MTHPLLISLYDLSHQSSFFAQSDSLSVWAQEVKNRLYSPLSFSLSVLDLGCGKGQLTAQLQQLYGEALGVDFSRAAIVSAQEAFAEVPQLSFLQRDILRLDFADYFDLAFDSHCFHCVIEDQDRELFLKQVRQGLKRGGHLALETMVRPEQGPYAMDESGFFWELLPSPTGNVFLPTRRVKQSDEIEAEILQAGFRIVYLKVMKDLSIDLPGGEGGGELMRLLAVKD